MPVFIEKMTVGWTSTIDVGTSTTDPTWGVDQTSFGLEPRDQRPFEGAFLLLLILGYMAGVWIDAGMSLCLYQSWFVESLSVL